MLQTFSGTGLANTGILEEKMRESIWIAWERQRRSVELARQFKCRLYIFEESGLLRYPISVLKTVRLLLAQKPTKLFVQNPSMVLAALACFYGKLTGTLVIVDRHTTFMLDRQYKKSLGLLIFKLLHRYTIRVADGTIVTNQFLAGLVSDLGGNAYVLPDKLPHLEQQKSIPLMPGCNILLISSFGKDEPIMDVLSAMESLQNEGVNVYITGNCTKLSENVRASAPRNVVFTGFVDEQEFVDMLFSVDIVMALTTAENCLLCGCYEGVSARKPLITSNKRVLREYFEDAVFVDNSEAGIASGIRAVVERLDSHKSQVEEIRSRIDAKWQRSYQEVEHFVGANKEIVA